MKVKFFIGITLIKKFYEEGLDENAENLEIAEIRTLNSNYYEFDLSEDQKVAIIYDEACALISERSSS